jgi:hypothetical protein
MATKDQLEDIINSPLSSPSQKVMAKAQLAVLIGKQAEAESEIDTAANTVRLKGFRGQTFALAGGWRCHGDHKNVVHTFKHDIGARTISLAYAEELQNQFAAYGGIQGGEAQVAANHYFTVGRTVASTDEEQSHWLSCFPLERRDTFSRPDLPTPEQVSFQDKEAAKLAAVRRLKTIADSGNYGHDAMDDWLRSDSKFPDSPEGEEILRLVTIILEDITAMFERGNRPELKWRNLSKISVKEKPTVRQEQS